MIYTITSTLPPVHGGRTKALLSRIKLIDSELGIKSKILTTTYNANYPSVYEKFINEGKVTEHTEFENLYDWLSGFKLLETPKTKFKKQPKYQTMDRELEGLESKSFKDGNVMRYYKNNNYVLYRKYYDNSNIVQLEDFMSSISKKRLDVGNIMNLVNCIEKFTTRINLFRNYVKFILIHTELYTVKNFLIQREKV